METPFTIDNLIRSFTRIYQQFDPANVSVIENEMRKMVPSENSTVLFSSGANYTENRMGVNVTITNPLPIEQTQAMTFDDIVKLYIMKTSEVEKLPIVYRCIHFLENSWGESYFIDGGSVLYDKEMDDYYFYFVIFKENKK